MNWLTPVLLFLVTWLVAFASTQFAPVTGVLGSPLSFLPAVVVYAAITSNLLLTTLLSFFGALALDSLSANRLGVSILPMFLAGFLIHTRRHVILRDQTYAQFWLGFGTALVVPLGTLLVMSFGQRQPLTGWATVWQLAVNSLFNGLLTPACFILFDAMRRTFDYQPVPESSFRTDREIKRGRF